MKKNRVLQQQISMFCKINKIKTIKLIYLLLILFSFSNTTFSQEYDSGLVFSNNLHFGKKIKVSNNSLAQGGVMLNEFSVTLNTLGKEAWHERYFYPELGGAFFAGYLGNEKLGYMYGLLPNINITLLNSESHKIKFKIGMGFAYFTKPYNSVSNTENTLIGSPVTNMTLAGFFYQTKLNKKLYLTLGTSIIHASNAHFQIPNTGLNMLTSTIGVKYYVKETKKRKRHDIRFPERSKKVKLNLSFGIGQHEFAETTFPIGTKKYNVYRGSLFISKRISSISNLIFGFMAKYYADYYNEIIKNKTFTDNKKFKSSILTAYLGHEFFINRFAFSTNVGYNFYKPFRKHYIESTRKQSFNRKLAISMVLDLSARYYLFNPDKREKSNYYMSIAVRSFNGTADFPELGVGIEF